MNPNRSPSLLFFPLLLAGLALASAGCSQEAAADGPAPDQVAREIRTLVTALTPESSAALPVEKSDWFARRKQTLDRMRSAGRDHGLEALRLYQEGEIELPEVRSGLLDVAAHGAPRETEPVLVNLVTEFGDDLGLRTKAAQFLGETSPEKAIEVMHPILDGRYDGRTYPPEERLLDAWLTASKKLGRDPVPLLASIATDIQRTQDVRHLATRALGDFDTPQSRQALRTLIVESSGNGYIRVLATQSLQRIMPEPEFCEMVEAILDREADQNFQIFLDNVLQETCR